MTAHALPRSPVPRSPRDEIRDLARTNPIVAHALALVDGNGLDRLAAMEAAVLELARVNQEYANEIMALRLAGPVGLELPDRDDDDHALCCGEVDCQCPTGGAA